MQLCLSRCLQTGIASFPSIRVSSKSSGQPLCMYVCMYVWVGGKCRFYPTFCSRSPPPFLHVIIISPTLTARWTHTRTPKKFPTPKEINSGHPKNPEHLRDKPRQGRRSAVVKRVEHISAIVLVNIWVAQVRVPLVLLVGIWIRKNSIINT